MIKRYNQYLKENLDYSDIDPYGEEIWDEEELSPILYIAKQQGIPYEQITTLDCSCRNLDSLEGIQNLIHLKRLWCNNNNNLTSLNGIENLINLKKLFCDNNNLTSLNGIENLINMKLLYCGGNNLTSLNEIENLINLKELYCFRNNLTNLNGIEYLMNLIYLDCSNNNFSTEYRKYLIDYCKKKKIYLYL